eukprot:GFKZ01009504.1.p1 GENE.GFKZ01009504.1~~GFKZ01009504.1.p1  ORF type:complete len:484 (+),score=67.09 GFKZ01009504.1:306-1757(+)
MNHYIISPKLITIRQDTELVESFSELNERLSWRELTTNLRSCEEPPYLFFRITLSLRPGSVTYAGFSTGAPFMLTRDKDVKKRAYFLRHWIRQVDAKENANLSLENVPHLSVAVQGDCMIARVTIDRPLVPSDVFKSVPFATWMFQIVEVDAVIQGAPGIRFAFSIERTVIGEEREVVNAAGVELKSKGPIKQADGANTGPKRPTQRPPSRPPQPTLVRPARPMPHMVHPPMQQFPQRSSLGFTSMNMRANSSVYPVSSYSHGSSRQIAPGMRQNGPSRSQYTSPHQVRTPSRSYNRSSAVSNGGSAISSADNLRPVMHPYLRLWEDRDLDDPYEPILVTEDDEYERKVRRKWVVEETAEQTNRFDYQNLFGLPTADYPPYYMRPIVSTTNGEADLEITVDRMQKMPAESSEGRGLKREDQMIISEEADERYTAAVVAAAEYNSMLRNDRVELRKWLEEDVARDEQQSEEEHGDEDGDGDSSD